VALARFVLQNAPEWSEAHIREAMAQRRSSTVRLAEPLPVVIAYSTTIVKNGKVHFFADIYGHDRLLDQALRQQAQARAQKRRAEPLALPGAQ
jgi:murein L,D-transpeptidase YcbB/YkuD